MHEGLTVNYSALFNLIKTKPCHGEIGGPRCKIDPDTIPLKEPDLQNPNHEQYIEKMVKLCTEQGCLYPLGIYANGVTFIQLKESRLMEDHQH